jgi:hypothetical protein
MTQPAIIMAETASRFTPNTIMTLSMVIHPLSASIEIPIKPYGWTCTPVTMRKKFSGYRPASDFAAHIPAPR